MAALPAKPHLNLLGYFLTLLPALPIMHLVLKITQPNYEGQVKWPPWFVQLLLT